MFLGDHFIGTEPYMPEFASIGLDAVVGSVGNGSTLRLISDIPGVKYTEGRFLRGSSFRSSKLMNCTSKGAPDKASITPA